MRKRVQHELNSNRLETKVCRLFKGWAMLGKGPEKCEGELVHVTKTTGSVNWHLLSGGETNFSYV